MQYLLQVVDFVGVGFLRTVAGVAESVLVQHLSVAESPRFGL